MYLVFDMIMLMVAAAVCFVAIFLAVSVVSIVSVLLKRIVMVCWMDIVAYNHPVKSIHAVPGWP